MYELYISAFVTLFVIIDPIGIAPIFAALTEGSDDKFKRNMALKGSLVAGIVLIVFAFAGKPFLGALGISIDALRVAGGLMLFLIALEMVFEKRTERKQHTAERLDEQFEDISVFPVAIPLLAGPGAIATVMLLMSGSEGDISAQGVVIAALVSVLAINLTVFLFAGKMMGSLGADVNAVLTRVLGIILAALAAQFVMDGLKATFSS
jgi:MarC family membrane protein